MATGPDQTAFSLDNFNLKDPEKDFDILRMVSQEAGSWPRNGLLAFLVETSRH